MMSQEKQAIKLMGFLHRTVEWLRPRRDRGGLAWLLCSARLLWENLPCRIGIQLHLKNIAACFLNDLSKELVNVEPETEPA